MKEVFVTYRWENKEHQDEVISFVDYLRQNGYNAEMDKLKSQQQTATDFSKMIHQAITDYDKVIIVLSEGYKDRAEKFEGGVGDEYSLIIKDIKGNPNKYVLVTFDEISDKVTPLGLKDREIIDLSISSRSEFYNRLHAKLQGKNEIEFSEVASEKPIVRKMAVSSFERKPQVPAIEILDMDSVSQGGGSFGGKIRNVEFNVKAGIKNIGKTTINDCIVEVEFPRVLSDFSSKGRIENRNIIYTFNNESKLYPNQVKRFDSFILRLNQQNIREAENSKLTVRVFGDEINIEKEFEILGVAYKNAKYGNNKLKLTKDDFLDGSGWG